MVAKLETPYVSDEICVREAKMFLIHLRRYEDENNLYFVDTFLFLNRNAF